MANLIHFSQVIDQSERKDHSLSNETSFFVLEIYVCESHTMMMASKQKMFLGQVFCSVSPLMCPIQLSSKCH